MIRLRFQLKYLWCGDGPGWTVGTIRLNITNHTYTHTIMVSDCEWVVERCKALLSKNDKNSAKAWILTARSLFPDDFDVQVRCAPKLERFNWNDLSGSTKLSLFTCALENWARPLLCLSTSIASFRVVLNCSSMYPTSWPRSLVAKGERREVQLSGQIGCSRASLTTFPTFYLNKDVFDLLPNATQRTLLREAAGETDMVNCMHVLLISCRFLYLARAYTVLQTKLRKRLRSVASCLWRCGCSLILPRP